MVIQLIKIASKDLIEAFNNSRAITTFCSHLCQVILEYRIGSLETDDPRIAEFEKILSTIYWYSNRIMNLIEEESISHVPGIEILSIILATQQDHIGQVKMQYSVFDLSEESLEDTHDDITMTFLHLVVFESFTALKTMVKPEALYHDYVDQSYNTIRDMMGPVPVPFREDALAMVRVRLECPRWV